MIKSLSIVPKILHDKFVARVIMDNYDVNTPMAINVTARRNDGEYMSYTIAYPDPSVDYGENIRIFFFDMGRSHVAQIISVFINGVEINTYYKELSDLGIQARYDDSLCRNYKPINVNDISLSFHVLDVRDPKVIQVLDDSEWGMLEDRKAIIEITTPKGGEPSVFFLGKNQVNTFTSMTLGLNKYNKDDGKIKYANLPDGIYDITIKGSPSSYNFTRKFLKTDVIRLKMDKLWVKSGVLCENIDMDLIESIKEIDYCISVAEANVRLGNIGDATFLMNRAEDLVDRVLGCSEC